MGSTLYIKRTASLPKAEAVLSYNDGTVQDLAGATVKFVLRNQATGVVKVYATATIVSTTLGEVEYQMTAADTDTAGVYEQEWEVTLAGGAKGHFPSRGYNTVVIGEDLKVNS